MLQEKNVGSCILNKQSDDELFYLCDCRDDDDEDDIVVQVRGRDQVKCQKSKRRDSATKMHAQVKGSNKCTTVRQIYNGLNALPWQEREKQGKNTTKLK